MTPSSRSYRDYTIGWICAVEPELIAAKAMLDEQHQKLPSVDGDSNNYTFGRIGKHNVVVASLPSGTYGTNAAAQVASQMSRSFHWLRFGLLVGIGGGVPRFTGDDPADIRLGDVVVSNPTYHTGGVIQYDIGKTNEGEQRPERTGTLNKPPVSVRTAVAGLKANHKFTDYPLKDHLAHMIHKHSGLALEYTYPGEENDNLFEAGYKHEGRGTSCAECLKDRSVLRPARQSSHPRIHYGTIASGNQVVKDSVTRDYWGSTEGVLCFEMEAAGLMDSFPCLVIRGICDYADSHKNTKWQPYAAATAAAYAKDLLLEIAPSAVQATDRPFGEQPESGNVHWMVPKITNTLFTGREDILEKLDRSLGPQSDMLQKNEHQKRFVIIGDGGIGKSEVCLKFANEHRQHFWGIFWVDASSEETAKQAFIDIGKTCGANAENFEQAKMWLANTRRSWLLIIDNADNHNIDYATFFPSGNNGNIILTTRNPQCSDYATVDFEQMDHLELQGARSLLFKAAGIKESLREDYSKAAEKVLQALGFHTLAIIQAGAFIKLRCCPLEHFPILLKKQEEQIVKYCTTQEQSTYGSVYATFEVSATHLRLSPEQSAADALDLLQILGFTHFQEIPELMFLRARQEALSVLEYSSRAGPQDEIYQLSELQTSRLPLFMMQENDNAVDLFKGRWRETLNLLESYSLIKISENIEDLSFSMHPLAHTWSRVRLGLAVRKQSWIAASAMIALSMRGVDYDMFHEKLRSHVEVYLNHLFAEYTSDMSGLEFCQIHYHICYLLLHLHDTPKLQSLLDMLETFKAWTGASWMSSSRVQYLTAICLLEEGKPKEAVTLLERLVESRPFDVYITQSTLARAYIATEQHQRAIGLLEPIIKIREKSEALESASLLASQHDLGGVYIMTRQFEKAAILLEKVVDTHKKISVPTHPHRLSSEHTLGVAYIGTNQCEKAADILQQVLEIRRKILNVTDYRLLATKHELARAYLGMGEDHYGRGAELLEQVVRIYKETLRPDTPELLTSQENLAFAYFRMGNGHHGRAAEILEQVIRIYKETLPPDDPVLLSSQVKLAQAYLCMDTGHHGRAVELLEQVVGMRQKTLAPEDPYRVDAEQMLEQVYRYIEAERCSEPMCASIEEV